MLEVLEDERSVPAGRSVRSYHAQLVRSLALFEPTIRNFLEQSVPTVDDIREIARRSKRLWVMAKDLWYLIEVLNDPEIHNAATQTVSHGPFVAKRKNCSACERCKNSEGEYPHGSYLYRIVGDKWVYWGPVRNFMLDDFLMKINTEA